MLNILSNIVRYRFLVSQFIKWDVLGRYKGTVLGIIWMVISPLILFFLYVFIFSVILKVRFPQNDSVLFYGLNLFCGLIVWNAFAESLVRSSTAFTNNRNLLKKTFFPPEAIGLSITVSAIIRFTVELVLFMIILTILGYTPLTALYFLPFLIGLQLMLNISLSWMVSSACVYFRDIVHFIGPLLTVWFFMTPVVYPENAVILSGKWKPLAILIKINPMTEMIRVYREILLKGSFAFTTGTLYLVLFILVIFIISAWYFNKTKKEISENI